MRLHCLLPTFYASTHCQLIWCAFVIGFERRVQLWFNLLAQFSILFRKTATLLISTQKKNRRRNKWLFPWNRNLEAL